MKKLKIAALLGAVSFGLMAVLNALPLFGGAPGSFCPGGVILQVELELLSLVLLGAMFALMRGKYPGRAWFGISMSVCVVLLTLLSMFLFDAFRINELLYSRNGSELGELMRMLQRMTFGAEYVALYVSLLVMFAALRNILSLCASTAGIISSLVLVAAFVERWVVQLLFPLYLWADDKANSFFTFVSWQEVFAEVCLAIVFLCVFISMRKDLPTDEK